jgi:hypothetical protein
MSNIKLDLSRVKHVKSDGNSTTLQHKDGHLITLVHKRLSPDNQKQLAHLAQGGGVNPLDSGEANYAYNAGLPCRNPNCKSMGKPHPNCRCYSSAPHFAKGGKVRNFCAEYNKHESDCEYYKDPNQDLGHLTASKESIYARKNDMAEGGKIKTPTEGELRTQRGFWESESGKKAMGHQQKEIQNIKNTSKPKYMDGGDVQCMKDGGETIPAWQTSIENAFQQHFGVPIAHAAEVVGLKGDAGVEDVAAAWDRYIQQHPEAAPKPVQAPAQQWQDPAAAPKQDISALTPEQIQGRQAVLANQSAYEKQLQSNSARDADPNFNPDLGPDPADQKANGGPVRKMYAEGADDGPVATGYMKYKDPTTVEDLPDDGDDDNAKIPAIPEQKIDKKREDKIHTPDTYGHPQDMPQAQPQQPQDQPQPDLTTVPTPDMSRPGVGIQSTNPVRRWADLKDGFYNDKMSEVNAWDYDLANGHITPLTYNKLMFYNAEDTGEGKYGTQKSTLGKLGSLFSLLVSGAGSGLAHQPNAVIGMMNNTIQNDLEAQKQSKANAQNYLRLAQQHEMQKANINVLNSQAALNANISAQQKMNSAAFHSFVKQANAYPPGSPEQQKAFATLAMLKPTLDQTNSTLADRAATAGAIYSLGQQQNPAQKIGQAQDPEAAFKARQQAAQLSGDPYQQANAKFEADRHLPGVAGTASKIVPPDVQDRMIKMNTLDKQLKNLTGVLNQYSAMSLSGNMNPKVLGQMAVKAHETAALYNQTLDGLGMTEGRLGWLGQQIPSNPQTAFERLKGSKEKLEEVMRNNQMRKNEVLTGYGFPPQASQQSNQPIKGSDGRMYQKSSDGKYMIPVK